MTDFTYPNRSCRDPACPICQPPDNFAVGSWPNDRPVKLSPKQIATAFSEPSDARVERIAKREEPCTHGWEGLDDERPGIYITDELVQP